jgi:hypothetical protein
MKGFLISPDGTEQEVTLRPLMEEPPLPPLDSINRTGTLMITDISPEYLAWFMGKPVPTETLLREPSDNAESQPANSPGESRETHQTGENVHDGTAEIYRQQPRTDGSGTGGPGAEDHARHGRERGTDATAPGRIRDPADGQRPADVHADGVGSQQRPITTRAKEMLLNILEGRSYKCRWNGRYWGHSSAMGGACRRALQALGTGGYVELDRRGIARSSALTEAGRAVAEAYRAKLGNLKR